MYYFLEMNRQRNCQQAKDYAEAVYSKIGITALETYEKITKGEAVK